MLPTKAYYQRFVGVGVRPDPPTYGSDPINCMRLTYNDVITCGIANKQVGAS